jgi:hypothetical protein
MKRQREATNKARKKQKAIPDFKQCRETNLACVSADFYPHYAECLSAFTGKHYFAHKSCLVAFLLIPALVDLVTAYLEPDLIEFTAATNLKPFFEIFVKRALRKKIFHKYPQFEVLPKLFLGCTNSTKTQMFILTLEQRYGSSGCTDFEIFLQGFLLRGAGLMATGCPSFEKFLTPWLNQSLVFGSYKEHYVLQNRYDLDQSGVKAAETALQEWSAYLTKEQFKIFLMNSEPASMSVYETLLDQV